MCSHYSLSGNVFEGGNAESEVAFQLDQKKA